MAITSKTFSITFQRVTAPLLRVNFINLFTRSFYVRRSQKCKKLLELTVFFALLESECVKAAHKMLVKLTIGCHLPSLILNNINSLKCTFRAFDFFYSKDLIRNASLNSHFLLPRPCLSRSVCVHVCACVCVCVCI